jgi:hypothetical protein
VVQTGDGGGSEWQTSDVNNSASRGRRRRDANKGQRHRFQHQAAIVPDKSTSTDREDLLALVDVISMADYLPLMPERWLSRYPSKGLDGVRSRMACGLDGARSAGLHDVRSAVSNGVRLHGARSVVSMLCVIEAGGPMLEDRS